MVMLPRPRHHRLLLLVLPIAVLNWVLMAAIDPNVLQGDLPTNILIGNLFGTIFAHGALAAA